MSKLLNFIKKEIDHNMSFANIYRTQKPYLISATDGVGSKIELARYFNNYSTIGIDLVAMIVNDIMVHGGTPELFLDYYAVGSLDDDIAIDIIKGIKEGCKIAKCKLVGGETAILPTIYNNNKFDLAGFGIGFANRSDILPRRHNIEKGDLLLGLKSSGVHSNGFTDLHNLPLDLLRECFIPTKIYMECLELNSIVNGFAHITGGGFENIRRVVPNYKLYDWEFPDIFKAIQNYLNISKKDMLNIYNCGYGMVAIVKPSSLNKLNNYGDIIGEVT